MKYLSIILVAIIISFSSCKKDESNDNTNPTSNFKGNINIEYNNETLSTLRNSVILNYDSEDKQSTLGIYTKKADGSEITIVIVNVGDIGVIKDISNPTDSCNIYLYNGNGIEYIANSGTIKRVSENNVEISSSNTSNITLSGTASIGVFTND